MAGTETSLLSNIGALRGVILLVLIGLMIASMALPYFPVGRYLFGGMAFALAYSWFGRGTRRQD